MLISELLKELNTLYNEYGDANLTFMVQQKQKNNSYYDVIVFPGENIEVKAILNGYLGVTSDKIETAKKYSLKYDSITQYQISLDYPPEMQEAIAHEDHVRQEMNKLLEEMDD